MMTLIAGLAAAVAAAFYGLRAQMLRPEATSWPNGPRAERWAVLGLSLIHSIYVVAVVTGQAATRAEAVFAVAGAAYALQSWFTLYRTPGPGAAVPTELMR